MEDLFWVQYGNSVFYAAGISILSLLLAVPTGYAMARWNSGLMKAMLWVCCVLLFLPFQVTVLPTYILLDKLELLDTVWAILLPGMMSPLAILLLWLGNRNVPQEYEDAFRLESGSLMRYFLRVLLPEIKWMIVISMLLNFILTWNMVDQALIFLEDRQLWPLSLGLLELGIGQITPAQLIWYMLPALVGVIGVGCGMLLMGRKKV